MRLEITAKIKEQNVGIKELLNTVAPKGRFHIDLKKNNIVFEDFSKEKLDTILETVYLYFNVTSIDLNNQKKFKLRNDEKEVQDRKQKIQEELKSKKITKASTIKKYIFEAKVFSLTDIRTAFPDINFGTIRACVNGLKKSNLIVEVERGKYALR